MPQLSTNLKTQRLLEGGVLLVFALLLLISPTVLPVLAVRLVTLFLFAQSLFGLVTAWRKDQLERQEPLWLSGLKAGILFVLLVLSFLSGIPLLVLEVVIAIYQLLLAFINLMTYGLYRINHVSPRHRYLFDGLIFLALGVATFISRLETAGLQLRLLALYLAFLGLTLVRDAWLFDQTTARARQKRRIRVSLPLLLTALIPATTLQRLNGYLSRGEGEMAELYNDSKVADASQVDLEIFIHTSDTEMATAVGHVDIGYKGDIISFGPYDPSSDKLWGMISDGVLFKADLEAYLDLCTGDQQKTIFAYGLRLTDQQKAAVEERLQEIDKLLVPYEPLAGKNRKLGSSLYAYQLKTETRARFYKFRKSRFKTYFLLSTNCVLLADSIIGQTGMDILNSSGFITPGTYKDYLDKEYDRPNSPVVSRQVYGKQEEGSSSSAQ